MLRSKSCCPLFHLSRSLEPRGLSAPTCYRRGCEQPPQVRPPRRQPTRPVAGQTGWEPPTSRHSQLLQSSLPSEPSAENKGEICFPGLPGPFEGGVPGRLQRLCLRSSVLESSAAIASARPGTRPGPLASFAILSSAASSSLCWILRSSSPWRPRLGYPACSAAAKLPRSPQFPCGRFLTFELSW